MVMFRGGVSTRTAMVFTMDYNELLDLRNLAFNTFNNREQVKVKLSKQVSTKILAKNQLSSSKCLWTMRIKFQDNKSVKCFFTSSRNLRPVSPAKLLAMQANVEL